MPTYGINPYVSFIENRLFPGVVQHAAFHRLTGEIIELPGGADFNSLGRDPAQLAQLIRKEFLIPADYDPLASLLDQYVVRPIQNPAV
ncbi:MAG TPA: hypothetical protein VFZ71_09230, partial [Pyrinomonadaceae bacterium]